MSSFHGWLEEYLSKSHFGTKKLTEFVLKRLNKKLDGCHHRSHPTIRPGCHPTANVWVPTLLVLRSSNVETSKPQTRETLPTSKTPHIVWVQDFSFLLYETPCVDLMIGRWLALLNCIELLHTFKKKRNSTKSEEKTTQKTYRQFCHHVSSRRLATKRLPATLLLPGEDKGLQSLRKNNCSKNTSFLAVSKRSNCIILP